MTSASQTTQPIEALNQAMQAMIVPLFWGAVVLAGVIPIAAAVGGVVAGKVLGPQESR